MSGRHSGREAGFSLIEMLVSSLVTTVLIGGLLSLMTSAQFVHEDSSDRTAAQQGSRIAMNQVQRDVMMTGVGLTPMLPVFPLVVPSNDGVQLRSNPDGRIELLAGDTIGRSRIPLPAGHGFAVGDRVAVYDGLGNIDLSNVEVALADEVRVTPSLSRDYRPADGAAVTGVIDIVYSIADEAGVGVLRRQVNSQPAQVLARDVTGFTVRYFDDSVPPAEFTPATAEQQLRIRVLAIDLTLQSGARLRDGARSVFSLDARIAPRALAIIRG